MNADPIATLVLLVISLNGLGLTAHELEDDEVDRAVEVVIRNQTGFVNFFFSANRSTSKTILSLLVKSEPTNLPEELTVDALQLHLPEYLKQKIAVKWQKRNLPLKLIKVEKNPKMHADLVARFKFDLPQLSNGEIQISDSTFEAMNSIVRYALKTAGSTILIKSNVPPILVRANRLDLSKIPAEKVKKRCTIVGFVSTGSADN